MMNARICCCFLVFSCVSGTAEAETIDAPASMTLAGDWTVRVEYRGKKVDLAVEQAVVETVAGEKHASMPRYDERRTWNPEMAPNEIRGEEGFPTTFALETDSVTVRADDATNRVFEKGKDFRVMDVWGALGRTPDSGIGETQPVAIGYRYGKMRIDSIVLTEKGDFTVRRGEPHIVMPRPPELAAGETRLGNIWVKARLTKLEPNLLFPILETSYPMPEKQPDRSVAEELLPKSYEKLTSGRPLKILAWGDSVTVGTYLPDPKTQRWQEQFVDRLRKRYPNATIELTTEAWGGRGSGNYLSEPSGSPYNFKERILDPRPDLIVMEFVNDAGLHGEALEQQYGKIRDAFREIGAEWVILTPHYVRPDWMGLDREREIDDDPRPYTQSLRRFAKENGIAVADAAARYGRLWRQGIPYSTLMSNNINHPNTPGLTIFADALLELFPEPRR